MNKIKNFFKNLDTKKRTIVIIALVCFIALSTTLVFKFTFSISNQTFYGVELKDANIGNVKLSNISMKEENGITKYEANIKASEDTSIKYVRIIIKDESNNEIVTLIGYVGSSISKNSDRTIEASTDADLSKIKSIEYEII